MTKPGRARSHVIPVRMVQRRYSVAPSGEGLRLVDRVHPPSDDTYGWGRASPLLGRIGVDLAEQVSLDQLEKTIARFEADLSRIEYGTTGAFYEWSDEQILAYLRQVFARRLASRS